MAVGLLVYGGNPVTTGGGNPVQADAESSLALLCGANACIEATGTGSNALFDSLTAAFHRVGLCWAFDGGAYVPKGGGSPEAITEGSMYQWDDLGWGLDLKLGGATEVFGAGATTCGYTALPATYYFQFDIGGIDEHTGTITLQNGEC